MMIIMEVHSLDYWRVLIISKERIYVVTGEKKSLLLENDEQIWEYLKYVRIAAEMNKTNEEMIVLISKRQIVDNITQEWARSALERCPEKLKKMRSESDNEDNITQEWARSALEWCPEKLKKMRSESDNEDWKKKKRVRGRRS